jgi:hypothetical protein
VGIIRIIRIIYTAGFKTLVSHTVAFDGSATWADKLGACSVWQQLCRAGAVQLYWENAPVVVAAFLALFVCSNSSVAQAGRHLAPGSGVMLCCIFGMCGIVHSKCEVMGLSLQC